MDPGFRRGDAISGFSQKVREEGGGALPSKDRGRARRCRAIDKIHGLTKGLKPSRIKSLQALYRRRTSPDAVASPELLRRLAEISREVGRQIAVLLDRRGYVECVVVGDPRGVVLPDLSHRRVNPGRLRGIRCVHTHLAGEPLSKEDLTDLVLLRLDLMAAVTVGKDGLPGVVHAAHVMPPGPGGGGERWRLLPPSPPERLDLDFQDLIFEIEVEIGRAARSGARPTTGVAGGPRADRAFLVSVSTESEEEAGESLEELEELARTAGVETIGRVRQRGKPNPKHLLGSGRLSDLVLTALHEGAGLLLFDCELTPAQVRSIADFTELKVLDRTQLILDIFARSAKSRGGKLQVELAQLKYTLPRLVVKNTAMSRLTGGIGGRGPGETKLEINRRRARERMRRLEKEIERLGRRRHLARSRRRARGVPVAALVGYTNAGKSTILNALTGADALVEKRLFSTLDPTSRRLVYPEKKEIVITDTVGFIKHLPPDLAAAFKATLEELGEADLLLHVVDAADGRYERCVEAVEETLSELGLADLPRILVFNKADLAGFEEVGERALAYGALAVSARNRKTLLPLVEAIEEKLWKVSRRVVSNWDRVASH